MPGERIKPPKGMRSSLSFRSQMITSRKRLPRLPAIFAAAKRRRMLLLLGGWRWDRQMSIRLGERGGTPRVGRVVDNNATKLLQQSLIACNNNNLLQQKTGVCNKMTGGM